MIKMLIDLHEKGRDFVPILKLCNITFEKINPSEKQETLDYDQRLQTYKFMTIV